MPEELNNKTRNANEIRRAALEKNTEQKRLIEEARQLCGEMETEQSASAREESKEKHNRLMSQIDQLDAEIKSELCELDIVRSAESEATGASADKKLLFSEVAPEIRAARYVSNMLDGGKLDGAEAEYNSEIGLRENQLPFEALIPLHTRADASTDIASTVQVSPNTTLARVFPMSVNAYLGVSMPLVDVGEQSYPVLATGANPSNQAKGAKVDAEAATVSVETLKPTRLTARYRYSYEDRAKYAELENTLRADIRRAIESELDGVAINGDGAGANPTGFIAELDAPDNPTEVAAWSHYIAAMSELVDGKYSDSLSQVRMLAGAHSYRKAAQSLTGTGDLSAADYLMQNSDGFKASSHIPAPTGNIQTAIGYRVNDVDEVVCPMWQGIELIPDRVSVADSGEILLTALVLYQFKILREEAYELSKFKLAA